MKTFHLATAVMVALAATLSIAPTASSDAYDCGAIVITVGASGLVYYIVIDGVLSGGYLYSVWLYQETNGHAEVQRGGNNLVGDTDWCQMSGTPGYGAHVPPCCPDLNLY